MESKSIILYDSFENETIHKALSWYCEPKKWSIESRLSQLILTTDEKTDYWQRTHYGFQADNGHFLYTETDQNFSMTTRLKPFPKTKYDQAGLMIRFSKECWIKTSMEYIPNGPSKLGAVVTNRGYSDWSTQYLDFNNSDLFFRLSKIGQNCYVDASLDNENWNQIRIAHLDWPEQSSIQAGLYACSPQGKGQEVRFDYLRLEALSDDPDEAYL